MSPSDIVTITLPDEPASRLDKALAEAAPEGIGLSRSRLAKLMAEGAISGPNGSVRDPKAKSTAGAAYTVTLPEPEELEAVAQDIPIKVIYEDDALIVVDKEAGMVVHPAPGSPDGTLVNALLAHCGDTLSGIGGAKRPGIVHRIDKDTSGLLVVAKSDVAHQGLAAQFEAHSVTRRYLALTHGTIDAADPRLRGLEGISFEAGGIMRVARALGRHPADRQKQAVMADGRGRHAVTRARQVESFGKPISAQLVECWLETGRTHQIRVHMAYAGLGLVGDQTYGGARKASLRALGTKAATALQGFPRQALHAAHLGFEHPVNGKLLSFDSELPQDMTQLLAALRTP